MTTTTSKSLLILGGGTAGTMIANKLHKRLPDWCGHRRRPGRRATTTSPATCSCPSRIHRPEQVRQHTRRVPRRRRRVRPRRDRRRSTRTAERRSSTDGRSLAYDYLVIATGTTPRPDQTPGMLGPEWRESIFDFYTSRAPWRCATRSQTFDRGRLVVHITEMPIKCPVAPLEFTFLADAWLRRARACATGSSSST